MAPAICVEQAPEQRGVSVQSPEVNDHQVVVTVESADIVEVEHPDRPDLARWPVDVHVS
jgi:hypothetical protein